jgi:aminoglycoside phosphotransferase (APT) family kinase protein
VSDPRADALARALVAYLRGALATPTVDLAETPRALTGGFDTEIYALRLRAAPPALAGPLVLRVLRASHEPARALREGAVQNALADLGYPVPRVALASADPGPLGAPFVLMERVGGRPLLERGVVGAGTTLAELQLRLHALDPGPVARALGEAGTLEGYLDTLGRRIAGADLAGLRPLLDWLRRGPPAPGEVVVCHGDFHPQNVLVAGGVTTGVLDWANALVAEPAFDVASTLNILRFVPPGLTSLSMPLRWVLAVAQPVLARQYLAVYRRGRSIDAGRLAYYETAAALRPLVRAGESRRRPAAASPLDASPFAARLLGRVRRLTGVGATLP